MTEARRGEAGSWCGRRRRDDPGGVACPLNDPKPHLDVASPLSLQGSWYGGGHTGVNFLAPPIAKYRRRR